MKSINQLLIYASCLVILAGCESYRDAMRSMGNSIGAIEIRDLQQADDLRKVLPGYLNLSSDKIRVEAGSGVVHVTILGVNDPDDRQNITNKMQDFQTQNPNLEPIQLRFE